MYGHQITGYDWRFGDGTFASGIVVQHSYAGTGPYFPALFVTYAGGQQSSTDRVLYLGSLSVHYPLDPVVGQIVSFDASYYLDNNKSLVCSWDFGDSVVRGVVATRVYVAVGNYTAHVEDSRRWCLEGRNPGDRFCRHWRCSAVGGLERRVWLREYRSL